MVAASYNSWRCIKLLCELGGFRTDDIDELHWSAIKLAKFFKNRRSWKLLKDIGKGYIKVNEEALLKWNAEERIKREIIV